MKKRAVKASFIVFEILAIILAVGAAGAAFFYWQLGQGPVSLSLLKPSLELAISSQLPKQYSTKIEGVNLIREGGGEFAVHLTGVRIADQEHVETASATNAVLRFYAGDIFSGHIGPKSIDVEGAKFRIVRNIERRIEIPAAKRREQTHLFDSIGPIFDGRILKSAFESAEIHHATITFADAASGRSWISQDATVSILRTKAGLSASAAGNIDINDATAAIQANAQYTEKSGVISVDIEGADFPIGDILTTFYGSHAAIIDAPVTGKALISFTTKGEVLASRFSAGIDGGVLLIGGIRREINFINWDTSFDPSTNQFDIEELAFDAGGNRGVVRGAVEITFDDDVRSPQGVTFDLTGSDLVVNIPDFFPEPLPVSEAAISGAYGVADRKVVLNAFDLSLLDIGVSGNFDMTFSQSAMNDTPVSPEINAKVAIEGALDPETLLHIWPLGVASGARDWIENRIDTAVIDNIRAVVNLPAGAVGENGLMPDETLNVTFDVSGANILYIKQMTPLTGAAGHGVLRGNSFLMKVERAQVGDIIMDSGEVEFPVFIPKWQPTYIRLSASGKSEQILDLLDQDPLRILSKIDLQPDQFKGDARVDFEIMRPNKRDALPEEYRYSGLAKFKNMEITGLFGDLVFSGGKGKVDLRPRSMTVTADANLSDAPIKIVWRQNFFEQDGPSTFTASGVIDPSTGDLFGISSRQFLRGPVEFKADATGELGAFKTVDVHADFSAAALTIDALDWRKPMGAPAEGVIRIELSPEEIAVTNISLEGEGVSVVGNLLFDGEGVIQRVHLPRLYFENAADLSIMARRNQAGALVVNAVGEHLTAGPLVEALIEGGAGDKRSAAVDWGAGLTLTARIDRMSMREGVEYRVAALDLWRDAERLHALKFTAFDKDGSPLTVNMALTGEDEGPRQTITAQSGAIGTLLRGVFGLTSVSGGEGVMEINLSEPGEAGISGQLEARNLKIVDAPLLARIFSAGSLDGLASLLNGEGIDLNYAYGEFDYSNGKLVLDDMRATGPSVGITADGEVTIGEGGEVSLNGAIAPIYQLNSLLGNAPIIGDILIGKKGEGIFALSYSVTGERSSPTVLVNPLSALTPGIFRRMFDPQRTVPAAASEDTSGPAEKADDFITAPIEDVIQGEIESVTEDGRAE
jgi:AsmA-like C-terminal region/Protein of unknown function